MVEEKVVYKLVRQMKDGSLASLFINKKDRLPIGKWLEAEEHPTKGYAVRKGWHCTMFPIAPHLSTEGRVWVKVKVKDYVEFDRPLHQGGTWILAQKMKIIKIYNEKHYRQRKGLKDSIQKSSGAEAMV